MKYLVGMKDKLRNKALGLCPRESHEFLIADEAPGKKSPRVYLELQGLHHSCHLKIGFVLPNDNDVTEIALSLESPVPSQNDPFFSLRNLDNSMQVFPSKIDGVEADHPQPLGQLSQSTVNNEPFFHPI